jgi:hypothetical protein
MKFSVQGHDASKLQWQLARCNSPRCALELSGRRLYSAAYHPVPSNQEVSRGALLHSTSTTSCCGHATPAYRQTAVVVAGAVVTKQVPSNRVLGGIPALHQLIEADFSVMMIGLRRLWTSGV